MRQMDLSVSLVARRGGVEFSFWGGGEISRKSGREESEFFSFAGERRVSNNY